MSALAFVVLFVRVSFHRNERIKPASVSGHTFLKKKTETKWIQYFIFCFNFLLPNAYRKKWKKFEHMRMNCLPQATELNSYRICFVRFREISRKRLKPVFIILSIVVFFFSFQMLMFALALGLCCSAFLRWIRWMNTKTPFTIFEMKKCYESRITHCY